MIKRASDYNTIIHLIGLNVEDSYQRSEFFQLFNHEVITIKISETNNDIAEQIGKAAKGKTLLYIDSHANADENGDVSIRTTDYADSFQEASHLKLNNEFWDQVSKQIGYKIDLIIDACESGALFNNVLKDSYFKSIFTTAGSDINAMDENFLATSKVINEAELSFSFENFVIAFYHGQFSQSGAITYSDGVIFDSSYPGEYLSDQKFIKYLEKNYISKVCDNNVGCSSNILIQASYYSGKSYGYLLEYPEKWLNDDTKNLFNTLDNLHVKKTEFIKSIKINNSEFEYKLLISDLEESISKLQNIQTSEPISDDLPKEEIIKELRAIKEEHGNNFLEKFIGDYCKNPQDLNFLDKACDETAQLFGGAFSYVEALYEMAGYHSKGYVEGGIAKEFICEEVQIERSAAELFVPISFMYLQYLNDNQHLGVVEGCEYNY